MKTFLILGAGSAGTILANKFTRKLDPREWKVVVVDKEPNHYYQPGFLFIPFGMLQPHQVIRKIPTLLPRNVEYLESEVELIDPANNKVTLIGGKILNYDQLVIATGSTIRPKETEGLMGGGWQQNIFDFYTYEGAVALSKFLKEFPGGRVVLNIAETPIKCPVAPLEFVFLADWFFAKRGIRNKVEIIYSTPLSGAFTKPKASAMLGNLLTHKNIHVEADFAISEVDSGKNIVHSYDGRELSYDLMISIPVNMGAEVIERSGLGDDLNFVPTNKYTLQSEKWQNVWVLGDASNIPASKAGSVAHFQEEIAEENILAAIKGQPLPGKFDGHSNCYVESGYGKGVMIDFNYETEPLPGTYLLPVLGPFSLLKESTFNHWGKLFFRWMYWNLVLTGFPIPLPSAMSMVGKHKD